MHTVIFNGTLSSIMADSIVMEKKENEGAASLYRRFVKHFRSSGIQNSSKQKRFYARKTSKNVRKKDCLARLTQKQRYENAHRLGKPLSKS